MTNKTPLKPPELIYTGSGPPTRRRKPSDPWDITKLFMDSPNSRSVNRTSQANTRSADLKRTLAEYKPRIARAMAQLHVVDAEVIEILNTAPGPHRETFLAEKMELQATCKDVVDRLINEMNTLLELRA